MTLLAAPLVLCMLPWVAPTPQAPSIRAAIDDQDPSANEPPPALDPGLTQLRAEAQRLRPLVTSPAALALLDAVQALPPAAPTQIYYGSAGGDPVAYTAAEYARLDAALQSGLRSLDVDTERYYYTFFGSPLASVRAFDLAARMLALPSFAERRVLDFGFGSIGQLRLLTSCGAEAVGVDVMPRLASLYAAASRPTQARTPTLAPLLLFGRWPADAELAQAAGASFDLVVSKNTLKRGYVRPPVEVDPRARIDLGVTPTVFLTRVHAALRPGGVFLIYNLGGKPAAPGEPYRSATDIACPWTEAEFSAAGFDVLLLDEDDSAAARAFGEALGWDAGPGGMHLETELFASWTAARRRTE